jgi:hypothetical protein
MGLRQVQAAVEVELRDWWPLAKTAQLEEFEGLVPFNGCNRKREAG